MNKWEEAALIEATMVALIRYAANAARERLHNKPYDYSATPVAAAHVLTHQ